MWVNLYSSDCFLLFHLSELKGKITCYSFSYFPNHPIPGCSVTYSWKVVRDIDRNLPVPTKDVKFHWCFWIGTKFKKNNSVMVWRNKKQRVKIVVLARKGKGLTGLGWWWKNLEVVNVRGWRNWMFSTGRSKGKQSETCSHFGKVELAKEYVRGWEFKSWKKDIEEVKRMQLPP